MSTMWRILITGANKGIGLAIANRCLQDHDDTHVVMACRSAARGEAALAELCGKHPGWRERLSVLEMDTSSDDSVNAAASALAERVGGGRTALYAIVNNAGIAAGTVADILNTNVRGPRRVDTAFAGFLDPARGRVVQISSGSASGCVSRSSPEVRALLVDEAITWPQIDEMMTKVEGYPGGTADLAAHGVGASMGVYGLSKALLNSYTMALARENPNLKAAPHVPRPPPPASCPLPPAPAW
eukprot:gene5712-5653_t